MNVPLGPVALNLGGDIRRRPIAPPRRRRVAYWQG
jgi:hypothetical protein